MIFDLHPNVHMVVADLKRICSWAGFSVIDEDVCPKPAGAQFTLQLTYLSRKCGVSMFLSKEALDDYPRLTTTLLSDVTIQLSRLKRSA